MVLLDARRRRRISVRAVVAVLLALIAILMLAAVGVAGWTRDVPRPPDGPAITQRVIAGDLGSLDASLDTLERSLAAWGSSESGYVAVKRALRGARTRYKRLEGVIELYSPALAAALNSRRQEVDDDDSPPPSTFGARGFPVVEDVVLTRQWLEDSGRAAAAVRAMRSTVQIFQSAVSELRVTNAQLIEIGRQEIARVATLGIAGFDAPRGGMAMVECADALDGLRRLYQAVGPVQWPHLARERLGVDAALSAASANLRANPDFHTFDRLRFLAAFARPAARALDELRRATASEPVLMRRPWRADVASVYDAGAFDARVYAPSAAPMVTPGLLELGAHLFADARLSGPGTRACAGCHIPARAFVDGLRRARSIDPRGVPVARKTPTLLNAALAPAQFADERSATLEDQVAEVLRSPSEMASSMVHAAAVVGRVQAYREEFGRVFHATPDSAVNSQRIQFALAAYVRSLVALDSRFDRAVRGDTAQMSAEERYGFTVFMGKAGCGTCHFAPLFSGNTPPLFLNSDVEVVGTPVSPRAPRRIDPDSGRARIDHMPNHLRAFKTPSLRNVAVTAPYMHNGNFATLEQVVDFYDHGGGRGAGAIVDDQTLAADSLHLTAAEKGALLAFMRTLTDTSSRPPKVTRRETSPRLAPAREARPARPFTTASPR